ncbi:MAG: hypothetical protein HY033_02375 [Ignavibacteriae bacterium]|nr:hypothetical protein [Ignavibacteria bacterium]MBI3363734.1 hypothetical protein [Ignavibacteriota bacterium]
MRCVIVFAILLFGCGKRSDDKQRTISPQSINLAGVALYETISSLQALLPNLRCEQRDVDIKLCVWRPTEEERKQTFRGIDQLKLTFYKDTLQSIDIQYLQMVDMEYENFEQGIRTKYARYTGNPGIDSNTTVWQYDSLIVTLVPNRKPHWTGTLSTYTPILEFQERTLYKRWMENLEKRKVNPVY